MYLYTHCISIPLILLYIILIMHPKCTKNNCKKQTYYTKKDKTKLYCVENKKSKNVQKKDVIQDLSLIFRLKLTHCIVRHIRQVIWWTLNTKDV